MLDAKNTIHSNTYVADKSFYTTHIPVLKWKQIVN